MESTSLASFEFRTFPPLLAFLGVALSRKKQFTTLADEPSALLRHPYMHRPIPFHLSHHIERHPLPDFQLLVGHGDIKPAFVDEQLVVIIADDEAEAFGGIPFFDGSVLH
jgi:hypothetical protein